MGGKEAEFGVSVKGGRGHRKNDGREEASLRYAKEGKAGRTQGRVVVVCWYNYE